MKTLTLDPTQPLVDALRAAQANNVRVTLHLTSGLRLEGRVAGVGEANVLLAGLAQREFYDALIPLTRIEALEVQARSA